VYSSKAELIINQNFVKITKKYLGILMVRFAFSPTHDLTLNELRIALLSYTLAQQKGENFIVRVDDLDKEKNIEATEQETLGILELFGITYTQVAHQSQNVRFHAAMALDLLHKKKAFSCFCSDAWLENKKEEANAANETYHYDDACRNLPAELVIDNTAPFRIRVVRPDKSIATFDADSIDSFVIMNQDKTPTHTFASAVDDMLSDISTVISTKDKMLESAREMHIRDVLGYDKELEYSYIDSLTEDVSVKELLAEGYLPDAISNYLVSLGNEGNMFDIERLKEMNKDTLKSMDATELSRYVGFADAEIGELAKCYIQEVTTTKELKSKIAAIFEKKEIPKELKEQVDTIRKVMKEAPFFEEYEALQEYLVKESGLTSEEVENALRILLTNDTQGPDIKDIYKYLKNYLGELIK